MEHKEIMNIKETSSYLNCSISLLRKMIYENEIPFLKLHSKYFFKKDILDKWIVSKHNNIEIGGVQNGIITNSTKI